MGEGSSTARDEPEAGALAFFADTVNKGFLGDVGRLGATWFSTRQEEGARRYGVPASARTALFDAEKILIHSMTSQANTRFPATGIP